MFRRPAPHRPRLNNTDRFLFVGFIAGFHWRTARVRFSGLLFPKSHPAWNLIMSQNRRFIWINV
jgi:hypothetical protein